MEHIVRNEFPRSAFLHLSPLAWVMFLFLSRVDEPRMSSSNGALDRTFIERLMGGCGPQSLIHMDAVLSTHINATEYRHPVQPVGMGSHPRLHGCPKKWLSFSDKRQDGTSHIHYSRALVQNKSLFNKYAMHWWKSLKKNMRGKCLKNGIMNFLKNKI